MFDISGNYIDNPIRKGVSGKFLSPLRPKIEIETMIKLLDQFTENTLEITITFLPELREKWNETTLGNITEKVIRRSIKNASPNTRMILIGEHSVTGLFHYHGIITNLSGNNVAKLLRACKRHLGRTCIKQVKYDASYKVYMTKSYINDKPPTTCYNIENSMKQEWNYEYTYILINIDNPPQGADATL